MYYDLPNISVGDSLYIPCNNYDPINNPHDYVVQEIEQIFIANGEIILLDNDGDKNPIEWIGRDMFLSYESMVSFFKNKNSENILIDLLNTELKKYFDYVPLMDVQKIAKNLIGKGVRIQ